MGSQEWLSVYIFKKKLRFYTIFVLIRADYIALLRINQRLLLWNSTFQIEFNENFSIPTDRITHLKRKDNNTLFLQILNF